MKKLSLSPLVSDMFNENDQNAILDYIIRQTEMVKLENPKNQYFAIRKNNGLEKFNRIDVFVNGLGIIFLSEITE